MARNGVARLIAGVVALVATLGFAQAAYADLLPVEALPPSIGGSAEQGQTVTCSQGTWLNSPAGYSYSWQRNAADIAGATGSSYTLTPADVNHAITCAVLASNGAGTSLPAVSAPIVPVDPPGGLEPIDLVPPAISGSAQEGQTLSCSQGTWLLNPTGYSYSWQRDVTTTIASGDQYTLTAADVNHAITCAVVASNGTGNSPPAVSLPVVPLALPLTGASLPANVALPVISGSPEQGQTVTCLTGSWTNNPTAFAYSWLRTGSVIPAATGPTYTLTAADAGQAISCAVAALNTVGLSAEAISLPISPVGLPRPTPISPGGAKLNRPNITAFWINPGKLTILVKGRRRSTAGTTFHFILDQSAGVLIEIQKRTPGRVNGKRCVAVTRRNRKARACPRWVPARVRGVKHAHAGKNQYKWLGRVGDGNKLLTAGTYRVYIAANNAAGWSSLRNKQLTAVRKQVKTGKHHV